MQGLRNLKFTRKLSDAPEPKKASTDIEYPENWDMVLEVVETAQRKLHKTLDWVEAKNALEEAGVANATQALLILKTTGKIKA